MAGFKIRNVFILGGFAAFLAGLFVISCDVGLGSSVDTQPPTLAIDYPPVAAVVRGGFMLSGTCEDDKGVASVTVSIVDGENKPVGEPRMAEIADGRWTVDINEQELESGLYELPDGKYTFTVVAEDGAGRKSDKLERTLEIDNTFPVFIIKNPGTTNKDSPAAFGSSFKVVGLMAEDHDVSKMIVTVYDASGARLFDEWTEELVETAGGTEVTFARYDKAPAADDDLYKHYAAIYDVDRGGDQFYSCTVTVMDSAKEYRMPETGAPSSEDGNTSLAHFLYDDVYEKYMSALSESRLSVGDIKKILNGTVGAASSADDEEAGRASVPISDADAKGLAEELKKLLTDTSEARLQFKLNKDANPTWEVMGYNVDSDTLALDSNTGSKGGKVTFKASMGLDETYFYPRELKLYLFGPHTAEDIANNWKEMYGDADAWYDGRIDAAKKVYTGSDEELLATEAKAWLLYNGGTQDPNASSTGEFTTSIVLPTITADKQYIFAASGADMDGLDFVPSTGCYGFVGVASGTPPTISISNVCGNAAPKVVTTVVGPDVPFVIKGTANGRGSTIEEVTYEVTVYDESDGNRVVGTVSGTLDALKGKEDGSWEFNIADGAGYAGCKPVSGKMYKYSTVVYVSNSAGLSSQDNADLRMDAVDPVPRIASVSPVAGTRLFSGRDMNVVNGEILIAISVSDANLSGSKLKYRISEPEDSLEDDKGWIETEYSFGANDTYVENIRINTTEYDDEKKLELMLEAEDAAGNIGKSGILPLYISQESDRPLVASETSDTLSSGDIAPNKNLFGVTSNNVFKATVTDDDGIGFLELNVKKASDGKSVAGYPKDLSSDAAGKTSYSLSEKLPEQEGKYTVEITVRDNQYADNLSDEVKSFRSNSYTYNIGIDSANPTLEFTTQNRANTSADKDKQVAGFAKDTSGIKSIKSYKVETNSDVGATGKLVHSWEKDSEDSGDISVENEEGTDGYTSVTWEDSIDSEILRKGSNRRRYIVEDIYGNTATLDFIYYVDTVPPEILTVEGISEGDIINGGQIFLVKGTVSDEDNTKTPQGIDSVRWKVLGKDNVSSSDGKYDGADSWEVCTIGVAMNADNSWNWSAAINLADTAEYPDGNYILCLAAFDAAENQSKAVATAADNKPATQIAFANDTTAPIFSGITMTETDNASNTTTGSSISAKDAVTISGTVTESNLKTLEVKQVSSGTTTVNEVTVGDDGSWTYTISEPGNYSVSFTATDKAGNTASAGSYTIEIDSVIPQIGLDPTNTGFTESTEYLNSTEFMLRVLVNDTGTDGKGYSSGIKSVKAVVDGTGIELSTTGALRDENGSAEAATKNWTLYTGTIENLSESSHTVKISVEDNVGNTAETSEYTFTVDLTAPTLTINKYESPTRVASAITGTVKDTTKFQKLMVDVTQDNKRSSTGLSTSKSSHQITVENDGTWTFSGLVTDDNTKKETLTTLVFTAYDCAGNTTQQTAEVVFDNWEPKISIPAGLNSLDWSGSDTVSLKVLVTSDAVDLSGIDSVIALWKTVNGERKESLSTNNVRVDDTGKNSTSGEYCIWSGSLVGVDDGVTIFNIKTIDKAGNEVGASSSFKVDTVNPEIIAATATPSSVNNTLLQSESFSLKVSITAEDKPKTENAGNATVSGIMSYSIKKGSDTVVPETKLSDTDGNYAPSVSIDAAIPKDKIANGTNLYSVYVKDAAGRESAAYTLTVSADIQAPVVKIASPKAGSTVNKKITISGTIEDDGIIYVGTEETVNNVTYAPPKLEVSTNGTSWTNVPDVTGYTAEDKKTSISWSGTFDTTDIYGDSNSKGTLYVRMTAYDEAGNKGESAVTEITVDQDTDRPVLRFTAMTDFEGGWATSTGVVAGSLVDDDKADGTVVKGLWYIDSSSLETGSVPSVGNNNGWEPVEVDDAGNWEITIDSDEAQGEKTWHFYVIDNADGKFCNTLQTTNNALHCPYFQYRTDESTKTDRKAGITFTVDTEAPTADIAVARGADNTTPPQDSAGSTVWQTTDGAKFGPNQGGYLWIRVTVDENVGMPEWEKKPVILSIGSEDAGSTWVKTDRVDSETLPKATYIYYFAKELSSLTAGGTLSVSAEVQDNSGLKAKAERRITIDTDAPEVSIISPAASIADKVLGAVTIRGMASDKNYVSTVSKLEWAIPKKGFEATAQAWTVIENIPTSGSYTLDFTNSAETGAGILWYVQDDQVAVYDVKEVTEIEDWTEEKISGCFKVPIWFRVTDAVENVGYVEDNFIVVDRDGGKPLVSINTPEEDAIVSGTVTIYGTATDDISVKDVRLQIDANNDGTFDSADYDHLVQYSDIYPPVNGERSVSGDVKKTEQNAWYLLAEGTNSWKLTIPTAKIAPNGNGTLRVRAMAFDYDGNTRGWSEVRTATIDANAPQIKDLRVVQYGKDVNVGMGQEVTPVSERAYEAGMYISNASCDTNGQWYLTGEVTDDDGSDDNKGSVGRISFDRLTSSTVSTIDLGLSDITDIPDGTTSYILNIPLITTASGQIYYKITANDNSSGTTTQVITINIDSTAPSLYGTDGIKKNDSSALKDALRLTSGGNPIGAGNPVQNNNLLFSFGDDVVEDGSGLHSVSFWFERKKEGASHLYDPMQESGTNESVPIEAKRTDGKVYLNADGLPALYFTGATRGSENALTLPDGIGMEHIRPRGMIKIAGTYCTIDKAGINGSTITFTPPVSTTFTEGELILAQVVDNQTVEAAADGAVDSGSDDGDGMIETIRMAGSTYTWTASFDSANIPDGPVIIHATAMDKAGNVTTGSIETSVSNKRPRIAKVLIGTDLNDSGTFDYKSDISLHTAEGEDAPAASGRGFEEFSYYSALNEKWEAQSVVTLKDDDKRFKVRDGLIIVPEFVGGNGSELKYAWKDGEQSEPTKAAESSLASLVKKGTGALQLNDGINGGKLKNTGNNDIRDEISDFGAIVLTDNSDGILNLKGEHTLSITFWDETEETTPGMNSQWALLNIPLDFNTTDDIKPVAKIKPFYWNPTTINGAVSMDGSIPIADNGAKLGHIELPDHLPAETFTDSTGVKDRDPKVSGKIKLEGTVYDDWVLGGVSVSFGSLINGVQLASYNAGTWTKKSLPAGVTKFEIEDVSISQDGHTAEWSLELNTEEISDKAAVDQQFSIVAVDKKGQNGGNSSVPSLDESADADGQKWIAGLYQMDVVPYVTEIVTDLSDFNKSAPSVYSRTALGRHPVRAGASISLSGWNLGDSPSATLRGRTDVSLSGSGRRFTLPESASSGSLEVSVRGVPALNNLNDNDAGLPAPDSPPAYGYNRQPNNVNNDTLNDDLLIDVWEFKVAAKPVNGSVLQPHMKVGPSGQLGFSYANATLYFNMPGTASDDETYGQTVFGRNFGGFTQNAFAYDANGKAFGVALCPDTSGEAGMSANLQFFSQKSALDGSEKGSDLNNNYYNQKYARRIENTSIKLDGSSIMQDINRVKSPSMATYVGADGKTYVYVAYYDNLSKQVRFRVGSVGSTSRNDIGMGLVDLAGSGIVERVSGSNDAPKLNKDTTRDSISGYGAGSSSGIKVTYTGNVYDSIYVYGAKGGSQVGECFGSWETCKSQKQLAQNKTITIDATEANIILFNSNNTGSDGAQNPNTRWTAQGVRAGEYQCSGTSWTGDSYETGMLSYDGHKYCHVVAANGVASGSEEYKTATTMKAGEYVAVGSLKDGTAVIAWYDSKEGRLAFSYNGSPRTEQSSLSAGTAAWQDNAYYVSPKDVRCGTYVSMAVDAADGIHLAYYSASGGDLWYSYIASPTTQKSATSSVMVDSYGTVGTYPMIDVARDSNGGPFIPYISFRCESNVTTSASVKVAHPAEWKDGKVAAGVDKDMYTGSWEVSTVPTENIPITDYTNIGVNKDWSTGERRAFSPGTDVEKSWSGAVFAVGNSSTVYGNGTDNPVVSYAVEEDGVLEMAQKK